ncbi:site-specific integrase [Corynebacterium sp. USCH3]|uniref:tyrosine-type recombinase/integrase n=1 Tax=Corynebacterium sp. USCH3 TaxID=3024840 RepID=UPI003098F59B
MGDISAYRIAPTSSGKRRWQAAVRVRRHDGTETLIRRNAETPSEAKDRVREAAIDARLQTAAGSPVGKAVELSDRSSVAALAEAYVDWLNGERSASTIAQYRGTVKRYIAPLLSDVEILDATPDVLEAIEAHHGTSAWRSSRAVLGGAWKWALRRHYITQPNPVSATRSAARSRPHVTTVTAAELRALIERVQVYRDATDVMGRRGPRVPWLVHMLPVNLATGARISELVAMRWEAIEGLDDDGPVVVTLRGVKVRHQRRAAGDDDGGGQTRPRRITLARFAADALRQQREDLGDALQLSPWVWPSGSASGTHLQTDAVHRALRKVYGYQPQAAPLPPLPGLTVRPHVLRHTAGTWVAHDAVGGEQTAANFLGHLGQTVTAVHYVAPEVVDVAEVIQSRWEQ